MTPIYSAMPTTDCFLPDRLRAKWARLCQAFLIRLILDNIPSAISTYFCFRPDSLSTVRTNLLVPFSNIFTDKMRFIGWKSHNNNDCKNAKKEPGN